MVTSGAVRRAKLQSNRHHRQTNTRLFTGRMSFLSPSKQCQSTTWTCLLQAHLDIKGSSLPSGGMPKPPVSPLTSVPRSQRNSAAKLMFEFFNVYKGARLFLCSALTYVPQNSYTERVGSVIPPQTFLF